MSISSGTRTSKSSSPMPSSISPSTQTTESSSSLSSLISSGAQTTKSSSSTPSSMSSSAKTTESSSSMSSSSSSSTQTTESPSSMSLLTSSSTKTSELSTTVSSLTSSSTQTTESPSSMSSSTISIRQSDESSSSSSSFILPSSQTVQFSSSNPSSMSSSSQVIYSGCSWSAVSNRLQSCEYVTHDTMSNPKFTSVLAQFCEELECNIKCYINVVKDCYTDDEALEFDPSVYTVLARVYCHNFTDSVNAFSLCTADDAACFQTYGSAIQTLNQNRLSGIVDYSTYKTNYCNAAYAFKSCISFTASGSCTSMLATHRASLAEVSASFVGCGPGAQSNVLFDEHSGPLQCGTDFIVPNVIVIVWAIMYSWL